MADPNFHIIELISNFCKGEINSEETKDLLIWVKENKENKKIFKSYYRLYTDYQQIDFLENFDKSNAWFKIQKSTRKFKIRKLTKHLSYAAVLIIAISIGISQYRTIQEVSWFKNDSDFDKIAQPGSTKAILTLANGSTVNLEDPGAKNIYEEEGTLITKGQNNKLSYNTNEENKKSRKLYFNTVDVPRGGEYSLTLSDGTIVWLNAESSLRFPVNFKNKLREVYLTGEAFFEVSSDKDHPFIIHTQNTQIKAIGTVFNINSYPENEFVSTTLVEGLVMVSKNAKKELIYPGMQANTSITQDKILIQKVETKKYTSWVNGVLEFENRDLEYIMIQLSRWYNIDFEFSDEELMNSRFTGAIKRNESLQYTLSLIEEISDVKFTISDSKLVAIMREN